MSQRKKMGGRASSTPTPVPPPPPPCSNAASPVHVSGTMPSARGKSGLGIILPDLVETRTRSPASVNLHSTSVGFLVDMRGEPTREPGLPALPQPEIHEGHPPPNFSAASVLVLPAGVTSMRCPLDPESLTHPSHWIKSSTPACIRGWAPLHPEPPVCLPVHRVHKFDLVVEQGCFARDHGSPLVPGPANIAEMLSKRGGVRNQGV